MKKRKVLVTDYAWSNLQPERTILANVGADIIAAESGNEEELERLAVDVDGILTCWKPVTERVIRNASRCIAIGRYGIGLDNIAVHFATTIGILVTNVPSYCVEEVSDHAMALILSCARKIALFDRANKAGIYDRKAGAPMFRITGKTLGIVGFGRIGRALYRKAIGFGFKVMVHDPYLDSGSLAEWNLQQSGFDFLLANSDFISIHVPLNSETRHLFDDRAFRLMRPGAYLINTCRGEVVDECALLKALDEGRIAGSAHDVLVQEPPAPDNALIRHLKTVVTPHTAFYSEESLWELQTTAAIQMADVLSGRMPQNIVNPEVLRQPNMRAVLESCS
jgi:D-3-phosphoglycerate dehydrogenase